MPETPAKNPPLQPPDLRRAALNAALLLLVLLWAVAWIGPSFRGWLHEDDFHNIRWALEYRDRPWAALTERHAVHDHIRPLSLIAVWLGVVLSEGRFWGPQTVLCMLMLLSLVGVMSLGAQPGRSARAGFVAAALVVCLSGFQEIPSWNAWICVAGMLGLGLTGLAMYRSALHEGRGVLPGLLLMVGAGLMQELGALVFPLTAAACAMASPNTRRRRAALVLLSLGAGAATFAYVWHPANLARATGQIGDLWARLAVFSRDQTIALLDGAPFWPSEQGGPGLWLPLLVVPLARDLLGAERAQAARRLWLGGSALLCVLMWILPALAGPLMLGMIAAVLFRRRADPPVGLLLAVLTLIFMAPIPLSTNPNTALAGYGLAIYVAVELWGLVGTAPWLVGALLTAQFSHAIVVRARLGLDGGYPTTVPIRDRFLSIGALTRTLEMSRARMEGAPLEELEILPLIGVLARDAAGAAGGPGGVLVADRLVLPGGPDSVGRLIESDILEGRGLPTVHGGSAQDALERKVKPSSAGNRKSTAALRGLGDEGMALTNPPGFYVLGMVAESDQRSGRHTLVASDACDQVWQVSMGVSSPYNAIVVPLRLLSACAPLRVGLVGGSIVGEVRPFVAPLDNPNFDIWGPRTIEHVIDVSVQAPNAQVLPQHPVHSRP